MEFFEQVFTTNGRLNRLRYLKYQLLLTLVSALIGFVLGFVGGFLSGDPDGVLVIVPTGIWSIAASIGGIMLSIRRLHDLNKSGWFLLLGLVPLVNVIFILYMWLAPGTVGVNQYGADPLSEDGLNNALD